MDRSTGVCAFSGDQTGKRDESAQDHRAGRPTRLLRQRPVPGSDRAIELDAGAIGFTIDNGDANGQVAFDNLSIAKINRDLVLPPPLAAAPPAAAPVKPQGPSCADTPAGMAGLFWINAFDGEVTLTIVDHEYRIPGKGTLMVPIPPDKKFVIDAFIPGVGRLRPAPGPFTWAAGYCEIWSPGAISNKPDWKQEPGLVDARVPECGTSENRGRCGKVTYTLVKRAASRYTPGI